METIQKPPERSPRVSILLPVRNGVQTLPACLRSIRRQHERDWECVVVDDGSTDGTVAYATELAAEDARFRVVRTAHRGIVQALRIGLTHCRAPHVARMDADDVMHRDRLAAQLVALDAHAAWSAVGCHVRLFPRRHLSPGRRAYERWLNSLRSETDVRRDAYVECPVAHPTLLIRRDVLAHIGYRETPWAEDYDLLLRLLGSGHRIGVVPRRLLAWRDRTDRLSRTDDRYGLAQFTACKAAFLATSFLAGSGHYALWGFGSTGRALHRALQTHGKHAAYIVEVHPRRLGNRIHGATVIAPAALASLPRIPVVVSVAGTRPRSLIRGAMSEMGFEETRDFVCAA